MAEKKKGFDLAAALGPVPNLGTDTDDREQLKYIPLGLLHPDPDNFYRLDGLEELAGNIELIGLQQPLRVRPDPEHEGEYIVVSGHRRRAAIELLVSEGKEAFGQVPCLIDGHQESEAMRKLRLIFANSSTRKLTSAELSQQAVDVEKLLYQLQAEGTEFPGRMRDHVAEVCQTTKSKLARLKVIRDSLIPKWAEEWETGVLNESAAYELSRIKPEDQEQWYLGWLQSGKADRYLVGWHIENYREHLETMDEKGCFHGSGKCVRQNIRRRERARDGRCAVCCYQCGKQETCADACTLAKNAAKERADRKSEYDAEMAKKKAEREAQQAENKKFALSGWMRLGRAMQAAGLDGEGGKYLHNSLDWGSVEDIAEFDSLLAGTTPKNTFWGDEHPLENVPVEDIIRMANDFKVSVDYLMGRTDNPTMLSAEPVTVTGPATDKPQWIPGDQRPQQDGYYLIKIQLENENTLILTGYYNKYEAKWEHPSDGEQIPYPVIGWYPIPQDEEG